MLQTEAGLFLLLVSEWLFEILFRPFVFLELRKFRVQNQHHSLRFLDSESENYHTIAECKLVGKLQ